MTHVLKDHEQRATFSADPEEAHNVLVLEHSEQLRLPLEILPSTLRCLLQCLGRDGDRTGGDPNPLRSYSIQIPPILP